MEQLIVVSQIGYFLHCRVLQDQFECLKTLLSLKIPILSLNNSNPKRMQKQKVGAKIVKVGLTFLPPLLVSLGWGVEEYTRIIYVPQYKCVNSIGCKVGMHPQLLFLSK